MLFFTSGVFEGRPLSKSTIEGKAAVARSFFRFANDDYSKKAKEKSKLNSQLTKRSCTAPQATGNKKQTSQH